jgi:hypothetical protein
MQVGNAGSAPSESRTNRLSIAHLLLWLTMTSVVLACEQRKAKWDPFEDSTNWSSPEYAAMRTKWRLIRAIRLTVAPAYGATLSGAALALYGIVRGQSGFPTQPGHWLLIVLASQDLLTICQGFARDLTTWVLWDAVVACITFLVPACVATLAALRSNSWNWRVSFGLWSVGFGGYAAGMVIIYALRDIAVFEGISLVVLIPALVIAASYVCALACSFWELRVRRDIFHWIGVAALFAFAAEMIAELMIWQLM